VHLSNITSANRSCHSSQAYRNPNASSVMDPKRRPIKIDM
jgi:hypothetical protein